MFFLCFSLHFICMFNYRMNTSFTQRKFAIQLGINCELLAAPVKHTVANEKHCPLASVACGNNFTATFPRTCKTPQKTERDRIENTRNGRRTWGNGNKKKHINYLPRRVCSVQCVQLACKVMFEWGESLGQCDRCDHHHCQEFNMPKLKSSFIPFAHCDCFHGFAVKKCIKPQKVEPFFWRVLFAISKMPNTHTHKFICIFY